MSRRRHPLELLPLLAESFPQTFFTDPQLVRPLKVNIHRDLVGALPEGINTYEAKSFLYWYTSRPGYKRALLHGRGRVDLNGAVVESEIPDFIREQARESFLQILAAKQNPKAANRPGTRPAAKPGPPRPAAPLPPLDLKELFAMAIDAKIEVTLKFTTLPNAKPAGQGKMAFALRTPDGQFVTVAVSNKSWAKLVQANTDWPQWVAALTGTMGERSEKGFMLANPGLQVFEKKPKADTATPVTDTPPVPAAEPVPPPVPAAPVVVTTKSGTTVTVARRTPLSLKR